MSKEENRGCADNALRTDSTLGALAAVNPATTGRSCSASRLAHESSQETDVEGLRCSAAAKQPGNPLRVKK